MGKVTVSEYDGCGKCLVGVRRLSRMKKNTFSPERQEASVLSAVGDVGGHVIAWADDWEVSGATDPVTRPELGPWLRDEMGPYDGIAGAAVDRIGRNQRDVLNTAYAIHESGRMLITYGHFGPWDLDDPVDEARLSMESFGAQLELRSIQKRNREETERARGAGKPKHKPRYGYRFVRDFPTGGVSRVEIDPVASAILNDIADRILADTTGEITAYTEATRLNREGVLSPEDYRAVVYGREPKGTFWIALSLKRLLTSEGSLGYQMHKGRAVLDSDGNPVRLAPGLWDHAKRAALIAKTATKEPRNQQRARKGLNELSGLSSCGNCDCKLYAMRANQKPAYGCIGRWKGIPQSLGCRPAPVMGAAPLLAIVADWFLERYGSGLEVKRVFDPGTSDAGRIKEVEAIRQRLRDDRAAGLYDLPDDQQWYQEKYATLGKELTELKRKPQRAAGWVEHVTGRTVADQWHAARDGAARREILRDYGVHVKLYPTGAEQRVVVTGDSIHGKPLEKSQVATTA
jgi:site-specific DNA recombinase